jgi:hypothetical protein
MSLKGLGSQLQVVNTLKFIGNPLIDTPRSVVLLFPLASALLTLPKFNQSPHNGHPTLPLNPTSKEDEVLYVCTERYYDGPFLS